MCGRFTLTLDPGEIQTLLALGPFIHLIQPRYNIAPTQPVAIVKDPVLRQVELMRWGLIPSWAKDVAIGNRLINARAETITEKPSFRVSFSRRRCLVLADGFFEWADTGKGSKQPYYFQLKNQAAFTFAGIFDHFQSAEGSEILSCAIITCPANALVAQFHPRMPVIFDAARQWQWLDVSTPKTELLDMLQPYKADEMSGYPVSKQINHPEIDEPGLIVPLDELDEEIRK